MPNRTREEHSTINVYHQNTLLTSHVPKKNRAVILLTTNPELQTEEEDSGNIKPPVNLHYNTAKAGVDNLDKVTREFSFARKTSRWSLRLVYDLFEISVYNAFIIYTLKNPTARTTKHSRINFMKHLSYELAADYVRIRACEAEKGNIHAEQKNHYKLFFDALTNLQDGHVEGKVIDDVSLNMAYIFGKVTAICCSNT